MIRQRNYVYLFKVSRRIKPPCLNYISAYISQSDTDYGDVTQGGCDESIGDVYHVKFICQWCYGT